MRAMGRSMIPAVRGPPSPRAAGRARGGDTGWSSCGPGSFRSHAPGNTRPSPLVMLVVAEPREPEGADLGVGEVAAQLLEEVDAARAGARRRVPCAACASPCPRSESGTGGGTIAAREDHAAAHAGQLAEEDRARRRSVLGSEAVGEPAVRELGRRRQHETQVSGGREVRQLSLRPADRRSDSAIALRRTVCRRRPPTKRGPGASQAGRVLRQLDLDARRPTPTSSASSSGSAYPSPSVISADRSMLGSAACVSGVTARPMSVRADSGCARHRGGGDFATGLAAEPREHLGVGVQNAGGAASSLPDRGSLRQPERLDVAASSAFPSRVPLPPGAGISREPGTSGCT